MNVAKRTQKNGGWKRTASEFVLKESAGLLAFAKHLSTSNPHFHVKQLFGLEGWASGSQF